MGLPVVYRKGSETLQNFDYSDIASGTGYSLFYGTDSRDDTTSSYHLLDNQNYGELDVFNMTGDLTLTIDSSPFNLPRDVEGLALIGFSWLLASSSGVSTAQINAQVQKWDGTTATNIGGNVDSVELAFNGAGTTGRTSFLAIDLPLTKIKQGEQLRLVLNPTLGGNASAIIGMSPNNVSPLTAQSITLTIGEDHSAAGTNGGIIRHNQLLFNVPFRIDL